MTEKEKAKELLWSYLPVLEGWTSKEKTQLAKKCAIICVDEIISSYISIAQNYDFYTDVKKEIEKL